jgi:hypothetical protein
VTIAAFAGAAIRDLAPKIASSGSCPVFAVEGAKIPTFRPAAVTPRGLFLDGTLILGMIFSENRFTPRIKCGAGLFRIMP